MSKFFVNDSDDEESRPQEEVSGQNKSNKERDRIIVDIIGSEDEGERKVVTEKEKRIKRLREVITNIKTKQNNNDFVALLDLYENLQQELEKCGKVFQDEQGLPRLYVRTICQIQDHLAQFTNEQKKKFSTNNNRSFNTLKAKLKKNNANPALTAKIQAFTENPINTDQSEQEAKGDQSSDESQKKEQSSESEDDDKKYLQSNDPMIRRKYWLKKVVKRQDSSSDEEKRKIKPKAQEDAEYVDRFQAQDFNLVIDYSSEAVQKKLEQIVAQRNNSKDQKENILYCEKYSQHFILDNPKKSLEILLITINLQIDQFKRENPIYITKDQWAIIYKNLELALFLYKEKVQKFEYLLTYSKLDEEHFFNEKRFLNTLYLNFQTLENELNQAFQNIDFFIQEYAERLSDQYQLLHLSQKLLQIFEQKQDIQNIAKLSFKQIEGIYFYTPQLINKLLEFTHLKQTASPLEIFGNGDLPARIKQLVQNIQAGGDEDLIVKASLYQTFNLSINGFYQEANDLFISQTPYELVSQMKSFNQLIYNRTIIQLGIAAFREGLIYESHQYLADLMTRDKILKDILCQNYTRSSENETKVQNMPYHLSINLEIVEFIYLVVSMILEVPNIQADPYDEGHKSISRKFRQLCSYYDAQAFNGQPENMRDMLYAASKDLGRGDWQKCWDWLTQIQIWQRIPNYEEVQAKLQIKVQEQALKCYLFTFKNAFTNMAFTHLENKFQLSRQQIQIIIYRLIYNQDIKASVEQSDNPFIIFQNDDVSNNKRIATQVIDKIQQFSKLNEKLLDAKIGSFGFQPEKEQVDSSKYRKKSQNRYKKQQNMQRRK